MNVAFVMIFVKYCSGVILSCLVKLSLNEAINLIYPSELPLTKK